MPPWDDQVRQLRGAPRCAGRACTAKRKARGAARGWKPPPPLRRERRAAEAPKAPEDEIPAVQEGMEGEAEVEMEEEKGPVQASMEMGEQAGGGIVFSFVWFADSFSFLCLADLGGRR